MSNSDSGKYPMLKEILDILEMPLQPMYTTRDVAKLFGVCVRAIQNRIAYGQLVSRNLPGRWKFFAQDLEDYLVASQKRRN